MRFLNPREELIGDYDEKAKTYLCHKKPEHFMRIFQGYGISDDILKRLSELGCETILITYNGANGVKILKSDIAKWLESKKKFVDKSMGKQDPQTFVSERDMEVLE